MMDPTTTAKDPMLEATLRQMADIALPPPVSMMPATWGWAALAGILLLLSACALWVWLRRRARNRYRREALAAIAALEHKIDNQTERGKALAGLPEILKRAALALWPREQVAPLSGNPWAAFLKAHAGRANIDAGSYRFFAEVEYDPGRDAEDAKTARLRIADARQWIEEHDVRS